MPGDGCVLSVFASFLSFLVSLHVLPLHDHARPGSFRVAGPAPSSAAARLSIGTVSNLKRKKRKAEKGKRPRHHPAPRALLLLAGRAICAFRRRDDRIHFAEAPSRSIFRPFSASSTLDSQRTFLRDDTTPPKRNCYFSIKPAGGQGGKLKKFATETRSLCLCRVLRDASRKKPP